MDIKTGQEKWKFKTGDQVASSPAVSDGVVYFGSDDSYLYAVDIKTGQEKWKFKTGDEVFSSPAISDGVVYFGSRGQLSLRGGHQDGTGEMEVQDGRWG